MNVLHLLLVFFIVWAIIHFWLAPLAQRSWRKASLDKKIIRTSVLALLEKLANVCAIGTIALLCLAIVLWSLSFASKGTVILAQDILEPLSSLYPVVDSFASEFGQFLIWFGALGLVVALFLVGRRARDKVVAAWNAKAGEIYERLSTNPEEELKVLRNDPAFQDKVEHLDKLLETLNQEDIRAATTKQKDQIIQEIQSLLVILALEKSKNEVDIEEVLRTSTRSENVATGGMHRRILRIFASEQLTKDLGLVSRALSTALIVLLLVSLTGWAASPLANSLRITVNNVQIHAIQEEVNRNLDNAISNLDPEDSTGDTTVYNPTNIALVSRIIARAATNQVYNSGVLEKSAGMEPSKVNRSEFVRGAILKRSIEIDKGAPPSQRIRGEVAKIVSDSIGDTGTSNEVIEQIERKIRPQIENLHERNPRLLETLLGRLEARYARTINLLDAQSNLLSHIVSQSFGVTDTKISSELGRQAKNIVDDVGRSAVVSWVNVHAKKLMLDTILNQAQSDMLRGLDDKFTFEISGRNSHLIKGLYANSYIGWSPSNAERVRDNISSKFADAIARKGPIEQQGELRRRLGGYSEFFPTVPIQAAGRGISEASTINFMNFNLASRSFRVRGVLVGRDHKSEQLDVTDIEWDIGEQVNAIPTMLSLTLTVDGARQSIGSFPVGIVNQAVRYAADKRVIAATIAEGDRNIVGRVTYVHPALQDTPLGCRVVEADRFIDTFTGNDNINSSLREIVIHRKAIRSFIDIATIAEIIDNISDKCQGDEVQKKLDDDDDVDLASLSSPVFQKEMKRFLNDDLDESIGSTDFVAKSYECAIGVTEEIGNCLCSNFVNHGYTERPYWFPEDHTSQVREKEIVLNKGLDWLRSSQNHFEHITLWLHTTFAIRTRFNQSADESTVTPLDFPINQIKTLNKVLSGDLVRKYVQNNLNSPNYDDFMSPLEDFIVLQRLMRSAFNGQLGEGFPINKLIELERETSDYVPHQPTIYWEPMVDKEKELLDSFEHADESEKRIFFGGRSDMWDRQSAKLPICAAASH